MKNQYPVDVQSARPAGRKRIVPFASGPWALLIAILIAIQVITPACGSEEESALARAIDHNLSKAPEFFEKGNIPEGAVKLLDTILMVKPQNAWPEAFTGSIANARTQFQDEAFSEGVWHIKDALEIFRPDHRWPEESGQRDNHKLAARLKKNILQARQFFAQDEEDNGIVVLLEALGLLAPLPPPSPARHSSLKIIDESQEKTILRRAWIQSADHNVLFCLSATGTPLELEKAKLREILVYRDEQGAIQEKQASATRFLRVKITMEDVTISDIYLRLNSRAGTTAPDIVGLRSGNRMELYLENLRRIRITD